MATLLDKESSYSNVEKILFVYKGCDASENLSTGDRHLHHLVLAEGWACGKDK